MVTKPQIETVLKNYIDPYLGVDLLTAGVVKDIAIENANIKLDLLLGYPIKNTCKILAEALTKQLKAIPGVGDVQVNSDVKINAHAIQQGTVALAQVKNIIAIASGKGGVGKSTVAVNLALALAGEGAQVGILDADIYGPSQPLMLGIKDRPEAVNKKLQPLVNYGVQSMSIGYLIDADTPMIWRGPMVSTALQQLLNDTAWQDLDYLIVDLPPGTGDIQLTLSQKIPVTGAVIVTTPQDIALADARKAIAMFQKVKIPVLGIVENMSVHRCAQCGHEEHIFGQGGGVNLAEQYHVDLLGSLPLARQIQQQTDSGKPTVIAEPEGDISKSYIDIALKIAAKLSLQAKNYAAKFPKIVIDKNS